MSQIDLYEAMSTLRAVRRLRTDPVPDDVIARVIQAAAWAPTGANMQPWRVIVVRDRDKMKALADLYSGPWSNYAKSHEQLLESMPAPMREKQEKMLRAANWLADHMHEVPAMLVFCFNPEQMAITDFKLERPSVVGGGSVYPAVQNALLACRAEGLGCTLTTLHCIKEEAVKELLGIADPWGTCAYIPIGYPRLKGHGPITRQPVEKMSFADTWGEAFKAGEES